MVGDESRFNLLEATVLASKGKAVKVRYYDVETGQLYEKIFSRKRITPSREIVYRPASPGEIQKRKHSYTPLALVAELKKKYPNFEFEVKGYGRSGKSALNSYENGNHTDSNEYSFIVWHKGNREDAENLEFFIDEEKTIQIFFRNAKKNYLARSTVIRDSQRLESGKGYYEQYVKSTPGLESILPEDITINEKRGFIQIRCLEKQLGLLPERLLRIAAYKSEDFDSIEKAEELLAIFKRPRNARIETKKSEKKNITLEEELQFDDIADPEDAMAGKLTKDQFLASTHADILKVVPYVNKSGKEKYYVKITADGDPQFHASLLAHGFLRASKKARSSDFPFYKIVSLVDARKEQWDPLLLNNATKQLRDFFPLHMPFDPNKSLDEQECTAIHPFGDSRRASFDLERALAGAKNFYVKNSVTIDLEVIDFSKTELISGRIFMASFGSATESRLYITKEAWHNEEFRQRLVDKYRQASSKTEFVFVDDELDMIARLAKDSQKYKYIIGHNFRDFDHEHLSKYNYAEPKLSEIIKRGNRILENSYASKTDLKHELQELVGLIRETKINNIIGDKYVALDLDSVSIGAIDIRSLVQDTAIALKRINAYKKEMGSQRLWSKTTDDVIDTYQYVKHRIDILSDHKLSTFAGFVKSLDYPEINRLIHSGTFEGLEKVVQYTLEDDQKSTSLAMSMIENGILEALATNKPLPSIFSSDPVKNFYDAGRREYFMKLNTFRDRHDMSARRHLERLKGRLSNEEILLTDVSDIEQKLGIVNGRMYYPSLIIETFKPLIMEDPLLRFMHAKMLAEKNILVKTDLIWKLSSALLVPVDKAKNYMEAAGRKFGQHTAVSEIYQTLRGQNSGDFTEAYEGSDDQELSRTSWIFRMEYGGPGHFEKTPVPDITVDTTILHYNNVYAKKLEEFRKRGFEARSKNYFVAKEDVLGEGLGYDLGEIKLLNLDGDRFVGRIDERNIYQSIAKPKNELVRATLNTFLAHQPIDRSAVIHQYSLMPKEHQLNPLNRQIIRGLLGVDPIKSGKALSLFDD